MLLAIGVTWLVTGGVVGSGSDAADVEVATDDQGDGSDGDTIGDAEVIDPASAARGPEGTRTLDAPPTELPEGFVPADAEDLVVEVARAGADWSAIVAFQVPAARPALEDHVEAAVRDAGYRRRDATATEGRITVVYDGPTGEVLAVTLVGDDAQAQLSASLVGPG